MAIALQGVSLSFGERPLLVDLDLQVPRGQTVALIGPSGVGKTTLLRILNGTQTVRQGSVRVLGEDPFVLGDRALRQLRRRIGHLQQNDGLLPGLRTLHNVLVGRLGHWSSARALWSLLRPQESERALEALGRVGLGGRADAPIASLSGGERQRVACARLLVQDPELVLADEPSASLDPALAREVVDLLLQLAREAGRTCLVTVHDLSLIGPGFDRVLALRDGGFALDCSGADFDAAEAARLFPAQRVRR